MNILLIGASGQLGQDIQHVFEANHTKIIPLSHADIEITKAESVAQVFDHHRPDVVINTAAFHNVEKCETQPQDAFSGNVLAAQYLAQNAQKHGAYLMHVSTDYVFDGLKRQPYLESDLPLPLNIYGNTKLSGEYAVAANCDKYVNIRTCGLYGIHPCRAKGGRNFVTTMLKLAAEKPFLKVVDDEILTPTSTLAVAKQIYALHDKALYGTIHATAEGACSWFDFAKAIFELSDMKVDLRKAAPGEFPVKVNRPSYSVLENGVLKKQQLNTFSHWREGLATFLASYHHKN